MNYETEGTMVVRGLDKLPAHMQEAAERWVTHGFPAPSMMGSFFRAVLRNELVDAFAHADVSNAEAMRDWAMWLYGDAPRACWGSRERVDDWHARGGLRGIRAAAEAAESREPADGGA